jgi:hypothetical protein
MYQTTPTVVRLTDTDLEAALDAVRLSFMESMIIVGAAVLATILLMTWVMWMDRKAVASAIGQVVEGYKRMLTGEEEPESE